MTEPIKLPKGRKLFVIGDSFTAPARAGDEAQTWLRIAAQELARRHDEPISIVNSSLMGTCQDWCWFQIHSWMESGVLTSDDYLIVAMTHPGRYWYIERYPDVTNSNIIDLDEILTKEEARAVEYFIRHIQRPQLDTLHLVNRLNYLAYQVIKKKLRKPLIIKCFRQDFYQCEQMDELNIATGSLFEDVQYWEFEKPELEEGNKYFSGFDCRYNHLCLSNHAILGPRVAESLYSGATLDLREGFIKNLLKENSLKDAEFCARELDLAHIEHRKKALAKVLFKNPMKPWNQRVGLADISRSTCAGGRP